MTVRLQLPAHDGARLAEIYRVGEVIGREQRDATVELTVRLEQWQLERLMSA